ncbi:EAL domain-containing protein, partial [Ectothiorhodospiraceae bacterium WFHF3C12]|nr:EAL domain-containing protein [Ectothiorhodospiraceae bacterium WFHF3C12]
MAYSEQRKAYKKVLAGMSRRRNLWCGGKCCVAALTGLVYLTASLAWIAFSDQLAAFLATNKQELAAYQAYKGFGFVTVMSVLVAAGAYLLEHRREQVTEILHSIRTDALTGLPVGAVAEEVIERQLERDAPFSVLLLDVRQLARINDALGRSVCDTVIQRVAQRIRDNAGPADVVARLEGDKFIIVFPPGAGEERARGIGARICSAFSEPITVDDTEVNLDLWLAMAIAPRDGHTAAVVLDSCERALQRAKTADQVCTVFSGPGDSETRTVLKLEADLRRAIREQQFGIVLQPQIDLHTFRVVGAEALVRWHEPHRGIVSPAEFIPVAESLGLVGDITNQVLEKAVEQWSAWSRRDPEPIRLGINLSGVDLNSKRIISSVAAALNRHRMPGHYLTLEITETWLAQNPEIALSIVERLRALGAQIAVDDFGTGYSSL